MKSKIDKYSVFYIKLKKKKFGNNNIIFNVYFKKLIYIYSKFKEKLDS